MQPKVLLLDEPLDLPAVRLRRVYRYRLDRRGGVRAARRPASGMDRYGPIVSGPTKTGGDVVGTRFTSESPA